ncbi:PREDICTED: uncharacterized protein LOC109186530 [Ipomoea nil]|uniref:uncharacterized protein LOC109186530 n=1 Tax=Ipomoea nil TaxID=35883 RepID=UPI000900AE00|nr:PREDICTED: uncharacterized protein LOC109186530 [Ipomoea nil]
MEQESVTEAVNVLGRRWADVVLDDEEDDVFIPPGAAEVEQPAAAVQTWRLVGRFLTTKLVKAEFMSQVMASVWQPVKGVQVSELQPGLFLFVFFHETDIQLVLEGRPWSFENHTLVCKQVQDGVIPGTVPLDTVDMWIQVHDLPLGYTSDIILEQVGNFLGTFIKIDDRFANAPWKTFHRIRVSISVLKPLKRRMKFMKRDKSTCWVNFKYERLHNFCYFCGMMGHLHKYCLRARDAGVPIEQYPYGEGLRAGFKKGPRKVGASWLLDMNGKPMAGSPLDAIPSVRGDSHGDATSDATRVCGESVVVEAATKRRRADLNMNDVSGVKNGGDVVMTEIQKNMSAAGTGSQTRPSL